MQSLLGLEQQAFHDPEAAPTSKKPEMLSRPLPLFASRA